MEGGGLGQRLETHVKEALPLCREGGGSHESKRVWSFCVWGREPDWRHETGDETTGATRLETRETERGIARDVERLSSDAGDTRRTATRKPKSYSGVPGKSC